MGTKPEPEPSRGPGEITRLLGAMRQGDAEASDQLLTQLYCELRRLAAQKMAHEAPGQTLQPTALVHEAWLHHPREAASNHGAFTSISRSR